MCSAMSVTVSGSDAVTDHNGIYLKQATTINGHDWWVAPETEAGSPAMYFSTSYGRWVLEAPDVYWEASEIPGDQWEVSANAKCLPSSNGVLVTASDYDQAPQCAQLDTYADCHAASWTATDLSQVMSGDGTSHAMVNGGCMWVEGDRRRFHGLSAYFGQQTWQQFSANYDSGAAKQHMWTTRLNVAGVGEAAPGEEAAMEKDLERTFPKGSDFCAATVASS